MQKYSIVASDLDGTLFDSAGTLSPENLAAIDALASRGVSFVPTTGRTLADITPALTKNESIRYIIHSNGAVIHDRKTGKSEHVCIAPDTARQVLEILFSADTHVSLRANGKTFADLTQMTEESYAHYRMTASHKDVLRNHGFPIDGLRTQAPALGMLEMAVVFFKEETEAAACLNTLRKLDSLSVVVLSPCNFEITHADASKGRALLHLASLRNVPKERVIAVGDSENDLSMIRAAGIGLATSGACDTLKKEADAVICSCDEHTIAHILHNFF